MKFLPHLKAILLSIENHCRTRKLQKKNKLLNILALWGKESSPNMKFTSQKITNNKIHIAFVDLYRKTFLNSDWPEMLTQYRTICLETPSKTAAQSNNWIESYT